MCFFKQNDIPDEFVNQVMEFVDKLLNMNVEHSEITNLLLTKNCKSAEFKGYGLTSITWCVSSKNEID